MKRYIIIICIFIFAFFYIPAAVGQEIPPENEIITEENAEAAGVTEETTEEVKTDTEYIEMDIKTSTLVELAAWCRELGLSEGGSREELASRLLSYYGLTPGSPALKEPKIITIESAKTTEYFTIEAVDEEYARLKGDVIVSLKDGEATHRIRAWEILYNRTRNVITASGDVEYIKVEGDTTETFKGDSITVNLDNWSGIFLDGGVTLSGSEGASVYRFSGTVISRDDEEVTVLSKATITNPANEDALWSISASRLWLLPGNDFAVLNAVLKVGNIPVFWFPAFFYPSDEIIFHPVLGYRSREGTFLQTTTYILGRPKTSLVSENSITKIFGGSDETMEKKREGVFLRTTGQKRRDENEIQLKLMLDGYVNMGGYLGSDLNLPAKGAFRETLVSAGFGLTRDIYPLSTGNTPFRKYDGVSDWNRGGFFSRDVPFRFRFNTIGGTQFNFGSFSWSLPYYSDPFVDRDFINNRSELVDLLAMAKEGITKKEEETSSDDFINSFEWSLRGSLTPSVTKLSPYISSISISNISSSLQFLKRGSALYLDRVQDPEYYYPTTPPNPGMEFFHPNIFYIYSLSASMSGTPYTSGLARAVQTGSSPNAAPGDSLLSDIPLSPWEKEDETPGQSGAAIQNPSMDDFTIPVLSQRFAFPIRGGPQFSFGYNLVPTASSELQFRTHPSNWLEQEDVNWAETSSLLNRLKSDLSLNFGLAHSGGGAYSSSVRLTGTGAWQGYSFINEEAEEYIDTYATDWMPNTYYYKDRYIIYDEIYYKCIEDHISGITFDPYYWKEENRLIKAIEDRAKTETYFTSFWNFNTSIRPFFRSNVWSNSNVAYDVGGLLTKNTYDIVNEERKWEAGEWDKDDLSTHQVSANAAAKILDYDQNLTVSLVLPPKDPLLSGNATFRAWITETGIRTSIQEPWDKDLRVYDPIYFTESLVFGNWGRFVQYVVVDPEEKQTTTLTSDLNLFSSFSASFSAVYTRPWVYNPDFNFTNSLWIQTDSSGQPLDDKLVAQQFRLRYYKNSREFKFWKDRFSFSINVDNSWNFNLQQYTNSSMDFSLGFKIGITSFMDLDFSINSDNKVIYRYFQKLPFFDSPPVDDLYGGAETNFFVDLFNSFRFGNEELRRSSGFKLRSFNVSLTHYLGDWVAKFSINMTPELPPGATAYRFRNEIAFLIQWIPIEEFKSDITYADDYISIR